MQESLVEIISKKRIAENVFEMTAKFEKSENIVAGQFLSIAIGEEFTLKRPFGILGYTDNTVTFAFRVAGQGTTKLAKFEIGQKTMMTFPLGNGFNLDSKIKKVAIVGGGIGVFPLLSLFEYYKNIEFVSFLGYNNAQNMYYKDEFEKYSSKVFITTDDGSYGEKGFITSVYAREVEAFAPQITLTCGNTPMLKSLQKVCREKGLPCLASTEERMGCGIGACLVCACKQTENGNTINKRVCADGPVFNLESLIF